jgi:hypothetical protein
MGALQVVTILLRLLLQSRAALVAEDLALRQQVAVLQRSVKRVRLRRRDRIFWVWLSRLWRGWGSSLIVVQPETVLRWHREGFRRSIRRECLDHVLVINEAHLRRVLRKYFAYYHGSRPYQSVDSNAPWPRKIEPLSQERIVAEPQVGGLHHRYRRAT